MPNQDSMWPVPDSGGSAAILGSATLTEFLRARIGGRQCLTPVQRARAARDRARLVQSNG